MKKIMGGFTLVELVVTVAIVGILASIAIPSYLDSVRKSRRSEAITALVGAAQALERYYTNNNTYVGAAFPAIFPSNVPPSGGTVIYQLSLSALTVNNYTITATVAGPQATDKCGNFSLTAAGVRAVTGPKTLAECWRS